MINCIFLLVFLFSSCRENLDSYSKENLLSVYENLRKENYEQAMKAILGTRNLSDEKKTLPSRLSFIRGDVQQTQQQPFSNSTDPILTRGKSDDSLFDSFSRSTSFQEPVTTTAITPGLTPDQSRRPSLRDSLFMPLNTIAEGSVETVSMAFNSAILPTEEEAAAALAAVVGSSKELVQEKKTTEDNQKSSSVSNSREGKRPSSPSPPSLLAVETTKEAKNAGGKEMGSPKGLKASSRKSSMNEPQGKPPRKPATPSNKKKSSKQQPLPKDAILSVPSTDTLSTVGVPRTPHGPPPKISDIKGPSKALQQFEEFLAQQQQPSKAASEGRKKANRTSRFRLPEMIANEERQNQNIRELINLNEIQKDRLKMELTLFQALNPKYTSKEKEIFVSTFKQLNPCLSVTHVQEEVDHILHELDEEIKEAEENLHTINNRSSSGAGGGKKKLQPLITTNITPSSVNNFSPPPSAITVGTAFPFSPNSTNAARADNKKHFFDDSPAAGKGQDQQQQMTMDHTQWDETTQLQRWQEYTLQNIITSRNSERKALPLITLPKSVNLPGKKFIQRGGHGVLVTIPAKEAEEPIEGPTSYLQLYKTSFQVRMSAKVKEKILSELKDKLPDI
jgi:hypothetical protein